MTEHNNQNPAADTTMNREEIEAAIAAIEAEVQALQQRLRNLERMRQETFPIVAYVTMMDPYNLGRRGEIKVRPVRVVGDRIEFAGYSRELKKLEELIGEGVVEEITDFEDAESERDREYCEGEVLWRCRFFKTEAAATVQMKIWEEEPPE